MTAATPLHVQPLTAAAFAPYGDVIASSGRPFHSINDGMVERHHDLAEVDVLERGGRAGISLFVAQPHALPLRIRALERHPLSTQAFLPMSTSPFLVVVAPAGPSPKPQDVRAFVTDGRQGVNYRRGVWHHVLLSLDGVCTYAVVDRIGDEPDCDVVELAGEGLVIARMPSMTAP